MTLQTGGRGWGVGGGYHNIPAFSSKSAGIKKKSTGALGCVQK